MQGAAEWFELSDCPPTRRSAVRFPIFLHLLAEVSLGNMLNPELPLIEQKKVLLIDALYEWVNGKLCCTSRLEKRYINTNQKKRAYTKPNARMCSRGYSNATMCVTNMLPA